MTILWILAVISTGACCYLVGRYIYHPTSPRMTARRLAEHGALVSLVRAQRDAHRAYEKDRVENRKRASWHADQRVTVVTQRVLRELHRLGLEGDHKEVESIVRKEIK